MLHFHVASVSAFGPVESLVFDFVKPSAKPVLVMKRIANQRSSMSFTSILGEGSGSRPQVPTRIAKSSQTKSMRPFVSCRNGCPVMFSCHVWGDVCVVFLVS